MTAQPLVAWTTPVVVRPAVPRETRVHAAVIGACVPALIACAMWWFGLGGLAAIPAFGVPIGAVLAAADTRGMLSSSWPIAVLRAAFLAPLIATLGLVVWSLVGQSMGMGGGSEAVIGVLGLSLFVACFALVIGMPVTLPAAWIAAFLLRRAAEMTPRRARLHVAALVGVTVLSGLMTLLGVVEAGVLSGMWIG